MKLTYWTAPCLVDSDCYSLRAKTRRECVALLADFEPCCYGPVRKVSVEYDDAFDLAEKSLAEGRGYWESGYGVEIPPCKRCNRECSTANGGPVLKSKYDNRNRV